MNSGGNVTNRFTIMAIMSTRYTTPILPGQKAEIRRRRSFPLLTGVDHVDQLLRHWDNTCRILGNLSWTK